MPVRKWSIWRLALLQVKWRQSPLHRKSRPATSRGDVRERALSSITCNAAAFLARGHGGNSWLDDAGFVFRDRLDGFSKNLRVLQIERRDHRDYWCYHVGGVEGSTQPYFDRGQLTVGIREREQCHRRDNLERRYFAQLRSCLLQGLDGRLDDNPNSPEVDSGDRLAIQRDPLAKRMQVRGRGKAGAITGGDSNGGNECRGRALSLGAGNMNDRIGAIGRAERIEQGTGADQPQLGASGAGGWAADRASSVVAAFVDEGERRLKRVVTVRHRWGQTAAGSNAAAERSNASASLPNRHMPSVAEKRSE